MRFEARVFRLAKDPQCAEENQDFFRMDAGRGIAAIADGVTAGIFSGPWAKLLVDAVAAAPPNPSDGPAFAAWLAELRTRWAAGVDTTQLQWFQRAKLKQGAFSTLLWLEFLAPEPNASPAAAQRFRCTAVGDSCLLHIRANQLVRSFPLERPEEFTTTPLSIGSVDLGHDAQLQFQTLEDECDPDDLLALSTDAVAEWALRRVASGAPLDWEAYWHVTEETWRDEVLALRESREMHYDDATLILLRVAGAPARTPVLPPPQPVVEYIPPPQPEPAAELPPVASTPEASAPTVSPQSTPAPPPLPPSMPELPAAVAPVLEKAKTILAASEDVAEKVAGGLLRGMQKMEKFLRKYKGKYPGKDDEKG